MNYINNGTNISGGVITVDNFAGGQNATIIIGSQTNNNWLKVDNWLKENQKIICDFEALQEQVNILKTKLDTNIEQKEKDSIFQKMINIIGSIGSAIGLINLIEEVFTRFKGE